MNLRARIAVTCLLLAGCQSAISRTVSARGERHEVNVTFTMENNLLRLGSVAIANRSGRYYLGSAHPRTVLDRGFRESEPRRLDLNLNSHGDMVSVEPIYLELGPVGDGIIGFDAWSRGAISIDYIKGLVTYQTEGIQTDGMALYRFQDEPAISVIVDGRRIAAALDTASPETLVLPRGTSSARRGTVDVEIAGTMFKDVDVALAEVSRARIGNRLLSKFLISIDYGQRQVGLWRDPRISLELTP